MMKNLVVAILFIIASGCASTPAPVPTDASVGDGAPTVDATEEKPCRPAGTSCAQGPDCKCSDCCGTCMGSSTGGVTTITCK
ncbi:hypothetical protein BH09MYX1_BH09MYX1_25220 [soil metagenome]